MNETHSNNSERPTVSLVIPGRNCSSTLEKCLNSVVPFLKSGDLSEIIFVDDGSTDESKKIAESFSITVIDGRCIGAAAARNDGIKAASGSLVWCLDADCISETNTLNLLVDRFENAQIAAVGGSLGNACTNSLLADLIQDEIQWRHDKMPSRVNFLASGNVVYRRSVLIEIGGFDEHFQWAHDAELAYRLRSLGWELQFCKEAIVEHHHFTSWWQYMKKQGLYAKNRMLLYKRYPGLIGGDDYSSWIDHIQPPLALALLLSLPLIFLSAQFQLPLWSVPLAFLILLALCSSASTTKIYHGCKNHRMISFMLFGVVRSIARGIGAALGLMVLTFRKRKGNSIRQSLKESIT